MLDFFEKHGDPSDAETRRKPLLAHMMLSNAGSLKPVYFVILLAIAASLTSGCGTRLTARGECKYRGYPKGSPGYDACQQQIKAEAQALIKQSDQDLLGIMMIGAAAYGASVSAESTKATVVPETPSTIPETTSKTTSQRMTLCPNGTYVAGKCNLAPDGTYVGGQPTLAPNGSYVGGKPKMAPDGSYVGGDSPTSLCPDGTYVSGRCTITPNGTYIGN